MTRQQLIGQPFLDLLFNTLCCFIVLFTLSFLQINEDKEEEAQIESKAEFLITMTWPTESPDDIDLWCEDPLNNLVFFRRRDQGFMHLDRDDLGHSNDRVLLPDGTYEEIKINQEIITLRGIIEGEYCVNAHLYSNKNGEPTEVTIKLEKVNPSLKLITQNTHILERSGDEKTFFRFSLDNDGNILSFNDLTKSLVTSNVTYRDNWGNEQ